MKKLKLFYGVTLAGHDLDVEERVNEWLKDFPHTSRILDQQVCYQMGDTITQGFCVAIWYEGKP